MRTTSPSRTSRPGPLPSLLLAAVLASGCLSGLPGFGPSHQVERTKLETGDAWNRSGRFTVHVLDAKPVAIDIEATSSNGVVLTASGVRNATLDLPDGTWTVKYSLDGAAWETQGPARIDSTPPSLVGLETLGQAQGGTYLLGQGARVEAGATVQVVRQADGAVVGTSLPVQVTGLADGTYAFDVVATDAAGNQAVATVQVRSGSATQLPPGRYTLGIVARYTSQARLWDLTALDAYATPAQARAATGGQWLGNGTGLTPFAPAVQAVVAQVVPQGASTGRIAFDLFRWMVDHTDYDERRLAAQDLLSPTQTIQANGGVCRDLAALYASLLRGSGVPARLVTGYLGGRVSGFHAWVEFYGGEGHGPSGWVPVDVSAVDGSYRAEVALEAFGVRGPSMLGLHAVTPQQEQQDWTHAASLQASYPQGAREPTVELADNLTAEFEEKAVVCVDPSRLARQVASRPEACPRDDPLYGPGFLERASYVLDYGVAVSGAQRGTTVTATLSYPVTATVAPDTVEMHTYGAVFHKDEAQATEVGTTTR